MRCPSAAQLGQFRQKSHCSACIHHPDCALLPADDEISDAKRRPLILDLTKPCEMFFPWVDALRLQDVKSDVLENTLEALATGVYLTDCQGRIVYLNRVAKRQVKQSGALCLVDNRLTPHDRLARITLAKAITEVAVQEAERRGVGITVALPARGTRGLVATIIPINSRELNDLRRASAAMVAIFVQDSAAADSSPGHAFAKLYGLTNRELHVVLTMVPGLSIKEAARVLGISDNTVKTHLKQIFAKTGTSKQSELTHLFLTSTPPILN